MNTLVIYDTSGFIISVRQGDPEPREPIGVPFLNVEIPEGKHIKIVDGIGVDVSTTPHQVLLEDLPPNEVDTLREDLNEAVMELTMLIGMGGM